MRPPCLRSQPVEHADPACLHVMDECLRGLAAAFHAAETVHRFMQRPPALDGDGVREASLPLEALHLADIDVMVWLEKLRLGAELDLVKVKREVPAALQPGIARQQRRGPVVAMRVDRPMCEDHIGLLFYNNL